MRVLVTGAAGYVGIMLAQLLLARGDIVTAYDRPSSNVGELTSLFGTERFRIVDADIRDESSMQSALMNVDAICHLAAVVGYPACDRDPGLAHEINVGGTKTLNRARMSGQPVIFASTGSVYGEVTEAICSEDTPLNPLTVYGQTKYEAEDLLLESGNTVCLRLATSFGLSLRPRYDLLVNDFCYRAVRGESLVLYQPNHVRSFIHVYDIARAFTFTLDNYGEMRDGVYNCGSNDLNRSKVEVARMVQRQTDCQVDLGGSGQDRDGRNYRVSFDKIASLGFATSKSLEEGIVEMVAAFRKDVGSDPLHAGGI